jgi:prolyl-tRNA synthetase
MRWSATLIPTLREDPADAVARSHRLLVRAGMVRQEGTGLYTFLPLGVRVLNKVAAVMRQEMERAGAVEVLMPALLPAAAIAGSGRPETFVADLFKFADRHGRRCVLAPTHEEVVTALARDYLVSYKQLPVILYQIQTKFRDEPRPRFGLVRAREFLMADAYSFGRDDGDLDECYERMREAFGRALGRFGLSFAVVEAESGAMGGELSHEFMVPCELAADRFVRCEACGYCANLEKAEALSPSERRSEASAVPGPRAVETPGRTTVDQVTEFLGVGAQSLIKTMLYMADDEPVAVLVRGDHDVNEAKVRRVVGARSLRLADAPTVEGLTGAPVGFSGPVGLTDVRLIVDRAVAQMTDAVVGANRADAHLVGVVPGRDLVLGQTHDVRYVHEGDSCPRCGARLGVLQGMEVGHIFRLGNRYSEALGAGYLDSAGGRGAYVMGCYGMGLGRAVAAVAETLSDDEGLVWPAEISPYEVIVMPLDMSDGRVTDAAEGAYEELMEAGVDVLLDDRPERPGAKFHDADLIGMPVRLVFGRRYLESGRVELQVRRDGARTEVPPGDVVGATLECLRELGGRRRAPRAAGTAL